MKIKANKIIHGDCLKWLPLIPDNSIDLCYIDPPFFTQKDWGKFKDKWNSIKEYIAFIKDRLLECQEF